MMKRVFVIVNTRETACVHSKYFSSANTVSSKNSWLLFLSYLRPDVFWENFAHKTAVTLVITNWLLSYSPLHVGSKTTNTILLLLWSGFFGATQAAQTR